jgi:branched-chain amino acid transport system substrate-binding protein
MKMKKLTRLICAAGIAAVSTFTSVSASAQEQYVPLLSYRVGAYASAGSALFGGILDYMNLVNMNGGINGVKLGWEECETEYNASRGVECYERLKKKSSGATVVEPLSTGIAYGLLDRLPVDKVPMTTLGYGRSDAANGEVFPYVFPLLTSYWNQAAGMIKYLGEKNGGMDKLRGKKIVHLYHDSAYGKEPIAVFEAYSKSLGFELIKIPIPPPGLEQQSQWLQIRQANPDHVILWGFGVMNATALKAAQRAGYPREKMLGVWWAGSEEDTVPAGEAAKGYSAMTFNTPGNYPVLDQIRQKVYTAKKGNMEDSSRVGSVLYMRGVTAAMVWVEALKVAQEKYGKGKVMTGEQMRYGLENINFDEAKQRAYGAFGMFPPMKTSCKDHEGSGAVKVQVWDGKTWKAITPNWVIGDREMIGKMVAESSAKYAAEKKITPGCLAS